MTVDRKHEFIGVSKALNLSMTHQKAVYLSDKPLFSDMLPMQITEIAQAR